jgi:hypothetical protein
MQVKKEFVLRKWWGDDVENVATLARWTAGPGASEAGLRKWLGSIFVERLGFDPAADPVVEVALLPQGEPGQSRIYFRVGTQRQADLLVQRRCALRATDTLLMEVLTPVEREYRRRLWPAFEAAQEAGRRAQFVRSRLYVDGKEVASPN